MTHSRRGLVAWSVFALGCAAGAVVLGPWLIPPLDAKQEKFRTQIEAGITVVRLALGAAAVLAVASAALWRRPAVAPEPDRGPAPRGAWVGGLVVVAVAAVLAAPRLGTCLWFDELSTFTPVVKRGVAVILSYSSNANNHVLNSLLMWVSTKVLGESEVVLHLPPFLFVLSAVALFYWVLLRTAGLRVAVVGGLAAAAHPWLSTHGVEARGYAGAVLFSFVTIAAFSRLLVRPTPWLTAGYVAAGVAAFGFITTTILVPAAHGAVASVLLAAGYRRPAAAAYRGAAANLVFACLWVLVLSLILFGLPLPQVLEYAKVGASGSHYPIGRILAEQTVTYLSGVRELLGAVGLAVVSAVGCAVALSPGSPTPLRRLMFAGLVPLVTVAAYVSMPGATSSARFFCFFLLPACAGFAVAVDRLAGGGPVGAVAAGLVLAGWLGLTAVEQRRLLTVNRPDLKALAADLRGEKVLLIGVQADVNNYYLHGAAYVQQGPGSILLRGDDLPALRQALGDAGVVVEGRSGIDNALDTPNPALAALGCRIVRSIPNAIPYDTEYVVYRRDPPAKE